MKKLATTLLALTLLSSSACANNDDIVATYSQGKIKAQDVMAQFGSVLEKQPETQGKKFRDLDKQVQETLIRNYINMKLIRKEADDLGLTKTAEFKNKLQTIQNYLLQQTLFEHKTKDVITETAIDKEYSLLEKALKGQKEVKVSHILVDSEEKAKNIKHQIFKGASFESIAKKQSMDESSKAHGGELGYVRRGNFVPEFEEKVFAMKKDEISNPVKTNFGWHVIKVHEIRDIKVPAKKDIENELKNKIANDTIKEYVAKLEKDANIELKI